MFVVHCHAHGSRVLLDTSRIEALHDTDEGPAIVWQCWCGARGHLVPATGATTPLAAPPRPDHEPGRWQQGAPACEPGEWDPPVSVPA